MRNMLVVLILAWCAQSTAFAEEDFTDERKELLLGQPYTVQHAVYCSIQADAVKLVDLWAVEEWERLKTHFREAKCFLKKSFIVVYSARVYRREHDGLALNIYAGQAFRIGEVFVISDWGYIPRGI